MPLSSKRTCSFRVQLAAWTIAALELVARAVGIDHQAGVDDAPDAIDLHRLLDRDGRRPRRHRRRGSCSGRSRGRALCRCPPGRARTSPARSAASLDHPPRARLGQDREPVGDRDPRRRAPPARPSAIRWRRRWAARPARAAPRCAPAGAARDGGGCVRRHVVERHGVARAAAAGAPPAESFGRDLGGGGSASASAPSR